MRIESLESRIAACSVGPVNDAPIIELRGVLTDIEVAPGFENGWRELQLYIADPDNREAVEIGEEDRRCNHPIDIEIDWGDGTVTQNTHNSSKQNSHWYEESGDYTITVRATDMALDGLVGEEQFQMQIELSDPIPGDSTRDGRFNTSDLIAAFREGKYETGEEANWYQGDWNGDGVFGTADLIAAFQAGEFQG